MTESADRRDTSTPIAMDMDRFRSMLFDSVGVGLAVVDPDRFRVLMHNAQFRDWCPGLAGDAHAAVYDLLGGFDPEAARQALDGGVSYRFEVQVKPKRRPITLACELTPAMGDDHDALLLQCQNISKIKELEYMIESYSKLIERQNRDLKKEKERVERILLNIMPESVYAEWKEFGVTVPQRFDEASVLMLDFVGFTDMTVSREPTKLISELNDIFTGFDRIVEQFGCERLKTMGDAYVAVSGMPETNPDHARNIAEVALRMVRFLKRRNRTSEEQWQCRIGINSGPVIGSIVGVQKYVYDIFGPGMNLAARMEPLCGPMEIVLCEDMHRLIENEFRFSDLGEHAIQGFGRKRIYRLEGTDDIANDFPGLP
ncbi:MAG: PAS domain-containing protein [Alphaproteobacteria bacterium]|nr:PAS domain-containing protein [Alphaproteobacteria bacterium]MCB9930805.1 PAS domain-containing protein [Alphaproteobacteria bacterium]